MSVTIPIEYQRILIHVLIENTWPAIIMDDYTIRIQLVQGQYFKESMYTLVKNAGNLPFSTPMLIQLDTAFKHDWKKELTGEGKESKVIPIHNEKT